MPIRIGTSGYSFQDWKGPFYPEKLPNSSMLNHYAAHFDIVEINATYYRIPAPSTFKSMSEETPPGFSFTIKLHSSMTHDRPASAQDLASFRRAIEPVAQTGKLLTLLAQFPWSFKNTPENTSYLQTLRNQFNEYNLHIEFRHNSWTTESTFAALEENRLGYCMVDEPRIEGLIPPMERATDDIPYIRFHGRNKLDWWKPRPGHDRYEYNYTGAELLEWLPIIKRAAQKYSAVLVLFNNCHLGHAPLNALKMKELLGLPAPCPRQRADELQLEP